jgi:phosphonatase-like hydrolase
MVNDWIKLVVFDMAGTTVRDLSEVEDCFYQAAVGSGLPASKQRIKDMQGLPKLLVVQTLWGEAIGPEDPAFADKVAVTFSLFREVLENHYSTAEVQPTPGALETFSWLRSQGIKVALTTGFYRKVTNIILARLGWDRGLDATYRAVSPSALIDLSLTPDETGKGRPHPDMILQAMKILGVTDASQVVKIGDTPADLQAGHLAGVGLNLAVTSGTHTAGALLAYPHDALLDSLADCPVLLEEYASRQTI